MILYSVNNFFKGHRMNWNKYPTLEIINEYLNFLTKNYPSICKQEVIGRTFENNTITMMKVSNGNPSNKAIILNAGSHAREWIAITSALVILREIVTNYDEQPSYMKDKDWYIIPLLNPDGFMYTQKTNRLWRKNRRRSKICYGVDINRNFNVSWYVKGISQTSECKNTYIGPHPFSEKESIALRDTVLKLKGRLNAVLDLHSYGQIVLHPWSGKSEPTDHKSIHNATAAGISRALYQHKKSKYKYGHTYHVIYPATGSALDWVYANGVVHSYVIEGPDKGYHGFLMPPEQIERTGMEMLAAVKYLADVLKDRETGEEKRSSWF
ncbi:unnamed protein product [Chilo suppressalis]|uniref:Peptidase M14 domain-containing protein n=1 Tax=Chilo suppressalis TaxID=168631 RepID=A0ABN8L7Q1_CHISP|nr:unnamed protein product [Chilo suppressalis]